MALFPQSHKVSGNEDRFNGYERRPNTPSMGSPGANVKKSIENLQGSGKFAETLSMFESKSHQKSSTEAPKTAAVQPKKLQTTIGTSFGSSSPALSTSSPTARKAVAEKEAVDENKATALQQTQAKIKLSTTNALNFCERLKTSTHDDFLLYSHEFQTVLTALRAQVYIFIGQTSSAIGTVDLRRNGIELTRFETEFNKEFQPLKPTDEFRHVLAQINTNIDYSMRRYVGGSAKAIIKPCDGYREEGVFDPSITEHEKSPRNYATIYLEHVPDVSYMRKHFVGQEHSTYVGLMDKLGPVIISLKKEGGDADDDKNSSYRAILRILDQPERREQINPARIKKSMLGKVSQKKVIELLHKDIQPHKLKLIEDKGIEPRLLQLDELQTSHKYKFGVLLCAPGQTTDNEFFQNKSGSLGYERFLTFLGDKVELNGFKGFSGGLDTTQGRTGTHSVYTKWKNYEVMYHVSSLLPYVAFDEQQIERKRHLGNDVINIIYLDGDIEFDPTTIKTQFTHIFIVVKEETFTVMGVPVEGYRIALTSNTDVPKFGPQLPRPSRFYDSNEVRDFLLAKMINGENAAYKAPRFAKPQTRTHHAIFESLVEEYYKSSATSSRSKKLPVPVLTRSQMVDADAFSSPKSPLATDKERDKQYKSTPSILSTLPVSINQPMTNGSAADRSLSHVNKIHSKSASTDLREKEGSIFLIQPCRCY
jgi:Rap/ran-GAP